MIEKELIKFVHEKHETDGCCTEGTDWIKSFVCFGACLSITLTAFRWIWLNINSVFWLLSLIFVVEIGFISDVKLLCIYFIIIILSVVFFHINLVLSLDKANPESNKIVTAGIHSFSFCVIDLAFKFPYFSIFVGLFIIFVNIFNNNFIALLRVSSLFNVCYINNTCSNGQCLMIT